MENEFVNDIKQLLLSENALEDIHNNVKTAQALNAERNNRLNKIRNATKSNELATIVAVEKVIIENDLIQHANSKAHFSSLQNALNEMEMTERLISIVDDKEKYEAVNKSFGLMANRKNGLPIDEARQTFRKNYARLLNQDKSNLSDIEKKILDARKSSMLVAEKLYIHKQAETLGLDLGNDRSQSRKKKSPKPRG